MGIKRYYATKDTTIVDAFKGDLRTRATDSNTGKSDILEIFSIYGQSTADSVERSRILIEFDTSEIVSDYLEPRIPFVAGAQQQATIRVPQAFTGAPFPLATQIDIIAYAAASVPYTIYNTNGDRFNFFFQYINPGQPDEVNPNGIDLPGQNIAVDIRHQVENTVTLDNIRDVIDAQPEFSVLQFNGNFSWAIGPFTPAGMVDTTVTVVAVGTADPPSGTVNAGVTQPGVDSTLPPRGDRLWSSDLWLNLGNEARAIVPQTARFYLKLFNAKHSERLPRSFEVSVHPLTQGWEEGNGLDLVDYSHFDEASWNSRLSTRIAQVTTIQLDADVVGNYQGASISLFDTSDARFNFFFITDAEIDSNIESGTDVAVDITNLQGDDTILSTLQAAISAQDSFAAALEDDADPGAFAQHIVVTNVTPGEVSAPEVSDDNLPIVIVTTITGVDSIAWSTPGAAFLDSVDTEVWNFPAIDPDPEPAIPATFTQVFELGTEDLEIDITSLITRYWMEEGLELESSNGAAVDGNTLDSRGHAGLIIKLSPEFEDGNDAESYYTKRFFARDSEFFFKRPIIEARWNSSVRDDLGRLSTANPHHADCDSDLSTYYYNRVNGVLTDFPNNAVPTFALTTDEDLANVVTLASCQGPFMRGADDDYTRNNNFTIQINSVAALRFDVDDPIARSTGYMRILVNPATSLPLLNHRAAAINALHKINIYWREDPADFDLAPKIEDATGKDKGGFALDPAHSDATTTSIVVRTGEWNPRTETGNSTESPRNRLASAINLANAINELASEYYHAELGYSGGFPTVTIYAKQVQLAVQGFELGDMADTEDDLIYAFRPDASAIEHVVYSRNPQGNEIGAQIAAWTEIEGEVGLVATSLDDEFLDDLLLPEYDACSAAVDPVACRAAAKTAAFGAPIAETTVLSISNLVDLDPVKTQFLESYWYFTFQYRLPGEVLSRAFNFHFSAAPEIADVDGNGNGAAEFAGDIEPPLASDRVENILIDISGGEAIMTALVDAINSTGMFNATIGDPGLATTPITVTNVHPGPIQDATQTLMDPAGPLNALILATVTEGEFSIRGFDFIAIQQGAQQGTDVPSSIAATRVSDGIYRADFVIPSNVSSDTLYEKWEIAGELLKGHQGAHSAPVKQWHVANQEFSSSDLYSVSITNLQSKYERETTPRFRVFVRKRNQKPNVVTKNSGNVSGIIVPNIYYSLHRVSDGYEIISFDLDNNIDNHTLLSYDKDGSYFDLDMGMLEGGYSYGIKLAFLINGVLEEQPEVFKFGVE